LIAYDIAGRIFAYFFPGAAGEQKVAIAGFFAGVVIWFPSPTNVLAVDTIRDAEPGFLESKHDGALPGLDPWVVIVFHHVLLALFDRVAGRVKAFAVFALAIVSWIRVPRVVLPIWSGRLKILSDRAGLSHSPRPGSNTPFLRIFPCKALLAILLVDPARNFQFVASRTEKFVVFLRIVAQEPHSKARHLEAFFVMAHGAVTGSVLHFHEEVGTIFSTELREAWKEKARFP